MTALPFDDSRRLTGSNLFFAGPGALLETIGLGVDAALLAGWQTRIERAAGHLGWEVPRDARSIVARPHAGGASLAFAAPLDQLFTATEINEWALCATLCDREPSRLASMQESLVAAGIEQAAAPERVIPPVIDETAALLRFTTLAAAERKPGLVALVHAAQVRGLHAVLDDELLTLGAGAGARSWPLEGLPAVGDVPWHELRDVPTAVVTGSNGKTTTVRLIAACARRHGWRTGVSCTDGVFVDGEVRVEGDYAGPAGTRRVLRDPAVEAAVLETARGGILRRGLAADHASVAVVTNVSSDHFGEYGIDDLAGLADAKLSVAHLLGNDGLLVLNADDPTLRGKAAGLEERFGRSLCIGWFALDFDHPTLREHREASGSCCGVRGDRLVLSQAGLEHDLGAIKGMPVTVDGTASYNIANVATAALAAVSLGVPAGTVADVLQHFGRDPADNAGRLMRFEHRGLQVVLDYAHNPEALRGVLQVTRGLRRPGGRVAMLLGHAGNRRDEDFDAVAATAASFTPDLVVVKETEHHLRGRPPGEVPALLRDALLRHGMPATAIVMQPSELEAARYALDWAQPGDAIALLVHASAARTEVLRWLQPH